MKSFSFPPEKTESCLSGFSTGYDFKSLVKDMTSFKNPEIPGQVENSETSEISEILEIFFQDFKTRVFDFDCRAKSKTRKKETRKNFSKISEISDFSELSICHFFSFFFFFFFSFYKCFFKIFILHLSLQSYTLFYKYTSTISLTKHHFLCLRFEL